MKVYSYRSKDAGGSLGTFTTLGELCAALKSEGLTRIGERLHFVIEVLELKESYHADSGGDPPPQAGPEGL